MKKKDFSPEMEEMEIDDIVILAGSPDPDCPGDVTPDPEPGCKTHECDDF